MVVVVVRAMAKWVLIINHKLMSWSYPSLIMVVAGVLVLVVTPKVLNAAVEGRLSIK